MPSIDLSVASVTETKTALVAARPNLRFAERAMFGKDGEGNTDDSFVLFDFDESSVALLGIEGVALAFERFARSQINLLETKISLRGALDSWSKAIDSALASSSSGARIARIAEVLPGLGTTFRRANIDTLLNEAANISREMKAEIGRIDGAYTESLATWKTVAELAEFTTHAVPVIGLAITALQYVENGLRTHDWTPVVIGSGANSANVAAGNIQLENAVAAWAARLERTANPVVEGQKQIQAMADAFDAATEGAVVKLAALEAAIDQVQALIDQINGLPAAIKPFTDVLGAMVAPFDAIFDFLENPPKIPFTSIPIFPPISRSNIDAIVNFLNSLTGPILDLLNPILNPILTPVTNAVNSVFDKLNPIKNFVVPMDTLDKLMASLLDAVSPLDDILRPILDLADDLAGLPTFVEEIEAPGAGETRATFFGGDTDDVVIGRAADPGEGLGIEGAVLSGGAGDDTLTGTDQKDFLIGGRGNDSLYGLGDDDVLFGLHGNDVAEGGDGDDIITGGNGLDELHGGNGDDNIAGNADDDRIFGDADDDKLSGGKGDDDVDGGTGNDILSGQDGNDDVKGGDGDDRLTGGKGDDDVDGGTGNDVVAGQVGDDDLKGGDGDDILRGGAGADRVEGGTGNDRLAGQAGPDTFVFAVGDGEDVVFGFQQGTDLIEITGIAYEDVTFTQRNGNTFVAYSDTDVIKLAGVAITLTEDDFVL